MSVGTVQYVRTYLVSMSREEHQIIYIFRGKTLDLLDGMPYLPIRALSCRVRMVIDTGLHTDGAWTVFYVCATGRSASDALQARVNVFV